MFDGPIRLYFAQHQEAEALKIYFQLKGELEHLYHKDEECYRHSGRHIFIMLYPSAETFDLSFPQAEGKNIGRGRLGTSYVVGIRGVLSNESLASVSSEVAHILKGWQLESLDSRCHVCADLDL